MFKPFLAITPAAEALRDKEVLRHINPGNKNPLAGILSPLTDSNRRPLLAMEVEVFVSGWRVRAPRLVSRGSMRLCGFRRWGARAAPSSPEAPGTCPQNLSPRFCLSR